MSEVVRHTGKVKKVDLKGLQEELWPTKFIKVNGDIWEIVEDREEEDYENLSIIRPNEDGTLDYILQFYNGGTCLSEMLTEGIKDIISNYEKEV